MSGKIAIVGAGPSGCYLAQALLKAAPDLEVDLLDTLPVPYGLVRYGVAADHQGTKAVSRQFARVFERQGARFFGNVELGRDITLDELRMAYDAVVLATGLAGDRKLGIPGEELEGIYGAGRITRALNAHPDAEPLPDLGSTPLIVGNGNVAIDLLRLLAKSPGELDGSDLDEKASAWLAENAIDTLTIVGRSSAARARFDPVMIKELAKLADVTVEVIGAGEGDDPAGEKNLEALAALNGLSGGGRKVRFRFGLTPLAIEGQERAEAVRFSTGKGEESIPCSSVLTAIGFEAQGDLPRDGLISAAQDSEAGCLEPGLYAVGWFRRGPNGTIPENRADAQVLAKRILSELAEGSQKTGRAILERLEGIVPYEGWQRIEAAELERAPDGRCRIKISTKDEMLRIAAQREKTQ